MYDGKKTNMAGIVSMLSGAIAWIWFTNHPVSIDFLGGAVDAILVALPISFVGFLIGNRFGKVLATDFATGTDVALGEPMKITEEEYKKEVKVEWLGVDGALCLLYAFLACFYSWGIINRIDWVIGVFCPLFAGGVTTAIFLRYLFEVFTFGKNAGKK
jgi:SSS family solute:Na+ symporter